MSPLSDQDPVQRYEAMSRNQLVPQLVQNVEDSFSVAMPYSTIFGSRLSANSVQRWYAAAPLLGSDFTTAATPGAT